MNVNTNYTPLQLRSEPPQDKPPAGPPAPHDGFSVTQWYDDLPKYPRSAIWGIGAISPALVGGALGGWEGALVGGAATAGFRHTMGREDWRGAAVSALIPTALGVLLPARANPWLEAGIGVALGAVSGLYVQAKEDAHLG